MQLDDTKMSEAALGAEKVTNSEQQEKREKISCALCSCTLNSESQAQAHFSGVRHLKLLERHGLPLPEGVNRDKLLMHHRKTYQNGPQRRQITYPTVEQSVSSNAQLSAYEFAAGAGEKRVLMCQLCGVGFNSAKQAESHYSGQKHRARETELKVGSMFVPIRMCNLDHDAGKPYSSDHLHYSLFQSFDENCSFSQHGEFITDSNMATSARVTACSAAAVRKTKRRSVNPENPRCDVCNREFNSNIQALSHFQGASHNDEVIRRAHSAWTLQNMRRAHVEPRANRERPQCSICNIQLNSASQLADHLRGRSHKRKEQEKANAASDDGTVTEQTESDGK